MMDHLIRKRTTHESQNLHVEDVCRVQSVQSFSEYRNRLLQCQVLLEGISCWKLTIHDSVLIKCAQALCSSPSPF